MDKAELTRKLDRTRFIVLKVMQRGGIGLNILLGMKNIIRSNLFWKSFRRIDVHLFPYILIKKVAKKVAIVAVPTQAPIGGMFQRLS